MLFATGKRHQRLGFAFVREDVRTAQYEPVAQVRATPERVADLDADDAGSVLRREAVGNPARMTTAKSPRAFMATSALALRTTTNRWRGCWFVLGREEAENQLANPLERLVVQQQGLIG